jgi:hypothetical protein
MVMAKEQIHETFRSGILNFDTNLSTFLADRVKSHWEVKRCAMFQDDGGNKKWAICHFER